MEYFNRSGHAVAYTDDGQHIYLWNGKPVAHIKSGRVFSYGGRLLGWAENGWLYDKGNRPALFSTDAVGGPIKPVRSVKPVKSVKQVKPVKSVTHVAPVRPVKSLSWSPVADENYFGQA